MLTTGKQKILVCITLFACTGNMFCTADIVLGQDLPGIIMRTLLKSLETAAVDVAAEYREFEVSPVLVNT